MVAEVGSWSIGDDEEDDGGGDDEDDDGDGDADSKDVVKAGARKEYESTIDR